jgi:hypothetical protein
LVMPAIGASTTGGHTGYWPIRSTSAPARTVVGEVTGSLSLAHGIV